MLSDARRETVCSQLMQKLSNDNESDRIGAYTISQISKMLGATLRTIRFYEEVGIIHPRREGVKRIFSAQDLGRLHLAMVLKSMHLPLSDVKAVIDLIDGGKETGRRTTLLAMLQDHLGYLRNQIIDMERAAELVLTQIESLRQAGTPDTAMASVHVA